MTAQDDEGPQHGMHHSCKLTSFCDVDVPRDGHAVLVGADREGNGRAALMVCPRCHAENREGRRFCGQCGLSFASTCPSCGFMNEGGEKFCGRLWQVADGNGRRDHRAPDAQGASESLRCRGGLMWHRSRLTTLAGLEFPRTRRPSPSSGASAASTRDDQWFAVSRVSYILNRVRVRRAEGCG